ncbi:MAG: DivIVA domain-containing protein [Clostridia bacterium]|nr:DivIVA domain-containing protein [Clostridia bacterium]
MNRNDIIKRKFSHAFFGYDVEDVDLFLDEVIRELDRIHNELDIETLKAEAARQREEKLRYRMEIMNKLLADAGISVDEELLAEAEAAHFAEVREAEREAARIESEAAESENAAQIAEAAAKEAAEETAAPEEQPLDLE